MILIRHFVSYCKLLPFKLAVSSMRLSGFILLPAVDPARCVITQIVHTAEHFYFCLSKDVFLWLSLSSQMRPLGSDRADSARLAAVWPDKCSDTGYLLCVIHILMHGRVMWENGFPWHHFHEYYVSLIHLYKPA